MGCTEFSYRDGENNYLDKLLYGLSRKSALVIINKIKSYVIYETVKKLKMQYIYGVILKTNINYMDIFHLGIQNMLRI